MKSKISLAMMLASLLIAYGLLWQTMRELRQAKATIQNLHLPKCPETSMLYEYPSNGGIICIEITAISDKQLVENLQKKVW